MKKYENPMLQIVSINDNDIITGSTIVEFSATSLTGDNACAADRFRDDWDAGY